MNGDNVYTCVFFLLSNDNQNNAKLHVVRITLQIFTKLGYETLAQTLYSPDHLPIDYNYFKHLNNFLSLKTFRSIEHADTTFNDFLAFKPLEFYWQTPKLCNSMAEIYKYSMFLFGLM